MDIPQSLKDHLAVHECSPEYVAAAIEQFTSTGYFTDGVSCHWGEKPEGSEPVPVTVVINATVNGEAVDVEVHEPEAAPTL